MSLSFQRNQSCQNHVKTRLCQTERQLNQLMPKTLNLTVISGFQTSHIHIYEVVKITPWGVKPGFANCRYVVEIAMKVMMVWGSKTFTISCKPLVNVAKQEDYWFHCSTDKWWNKNPIKQVVKPFAPPHCSNRVIGVPNPTICHQWWKKLYTNFVCSCKHYTNPFSVNFQRSQLVFASSLSIVSGQIIIIHQPVKTWNKGISLPKRYLLGAQVVRGGYNLTRLYWKWWICMDLSPLPAPVIVGLPPPAIPAAATAAATMVTPMAPEVSEDTRRRLESAKVCAMVILKI